MKNEIQKSESPLMAAAALCQADGNMDVAKLKELLDVQERWEAIQAKKAYVEAMSEFKSSPPEILKDKQVKYGATDYKHATLHNVTTKINSELSKHGLTASWVTSQDNGSIKVTCKITHIMGHSEETCLSAPPDATGSKNAIQAIGSAVFYLERYTLFALTGLAPARMDDDGQKTGGEISLLEQWEIKCDEAGTVAKSVDEIAKWWKDNAPTIKKELSKADAALIFQKVVAYKDGLKVPEREPGSDDE